MAAVILAWNPNRRDGWDYHTAVGQVAGTGRFLHRWRLPHPTDIQPGTEVWLLLQSISGTAAGLVGHGVVMSGPFEVLAADDPEATGWYAPIAFDALLPPGEQIPIDVLTAAVPGMLWDGIPKDPTPVPSTTDSGLRTVWRDHGPVPADPTQFPAGSYPPDAVATIQVNRYERDADARRVCLAFHGTSCAACGFSFEVSYGDSGAGFIHVHHQVPPAMLGRGYQLDPIADLVPLCPNCHAMAHLGVTSPRTVSELRGMISAAGHLRGEVVSRQSLEAREDAQRIRDSRQD
ncbi:Restriction endonuclease [Arthrobacter sp. 9AX]|uniref:HNH endonuclease n=1 Tax=Arthrobacter sp. 9AX TaxID=2653131 RepID=UPI0012F341FD|nr:HNH endonuclease [Arthrobacter sp. 9AX]VXB41096.1 Restriction endonuclease [Arthrobacter sp. 9AX]